jgi:hypothetical protein
MPLQIRRGTETERLAMTQKLAAGEPLWITTTSKLYIGDGATSTPTLLPVTGFTASDAQDAAASLFTTATHSGITFTYDTIADTLTAAVNLSSYNGLVKGDLKGSVFADDSTLLVDGNAGTIPAAVVQGTFTGSVVGNVSGNLTGNVIGNVTGNTTGYHTGDVKGSVVGDDSSMIVDAVNNTLKINEITSSGASLNIGTNISPTNMVLKTNNNAFAYFVGINTATVEPTFYLQASKGTLSAPTALAASDSITGINFQAYDGSTYKSTGAIVNALTSDSVIGDTNPKADIVIAAAAGGSSFSNYTFKGNGTFVSTNLQTTGLIYRAVNYIAVSGTGTYALSTTVSFNVLVVASTGYTATITLPPSPTDAQMFSFTVASNTVTLAMTAGPTVVPAFAGAGIVSGTVYRYVYRSSTSTWYRL